MGLSFFTDKDDGDTQKRKAGKDKKDKAHKDKKDKKATKKARLH